MDDGRRAHAVHGLTGGLTGPCRAPDGVAAGPAGAEAAAALPFAEREAALVQKILAYDPKSDTTRIEAAFALASAAHAQQQRDNGEPYITHPLAVADILAGYRLDQGSIITGLLHDTIEDTGLTQVQIERQFGPDVALLVDGVTKLTRLELQSDRTKQAENFRKLVLALSKDIRVLLVKLADRLHNMRTLHFVTNQSRRQRIARETMEIYAPLAGRIGMDAIKSELQNLSFAQLEPEAYGSIQARLNFLRGQGADVIEEVRRELIRVCAAAGLIGIDITGREKSPFSIWEKMQKRNVAYEQLSDIMAFRVLVKTRDECYIALGAIHSAFPVIAGRFKDYISTPKANGYQSIHTGVTLREPRNQKIEVQIRTFEMHDVAENGVAAHWLYKDRDPQVAADLQRFRWVQDLLEILENSQAPDEFLENTKLELYHDQVFCFTPKGELIQLPRGATPVDFAYAVHSQVGDTCVGAKINGRLMPLRYELQNGDQVEIMTARGGTPSPQWERFVVTGKARARVRRFVAQQQRTINREQGRAVLAKAFRQEGLDGSERALEPALKTLKLLTIDDLYVAVASGHVGPKDVVHAAYPEMRETARAPRLLPGMGLPARPAGGRLGSKSDDSPAGPPIRGLITGMVVSYAGCCHPLPGDPIVGIVATGRGVTIHTRDCAQLQSFAATPERFLDVEWDDTLPPSARGGQAYSGRISLIATNERDLLPNISNAVTKHDGSVLNLRVVSRQQDFCEILLDVEVRNLRHLSTVIAGLRATTGITQVERAKG